MKLDFKTLIIQIKEQYAALPAEERNSEHGRLLLKELNTLEKLSKDKELRFLMFLDEVLLGLINWLSKKSNQVLFSIVFYAAVIGLVVVFITGMKSCR